MIFTNSLFKYEPISEYSRCNLSKNQLFFNSPDNFNDPFDSLCLFCLKGEKQKFIDWYSKAKPCDTGEATTLMDIFTKNFCEKTGDIYFFDPNKKNVNQPQNGNISPQLRNKLYGNLIKTALPRVCCLTTKDKEILMWSHYADRHRGMCLHFQFGDETSTKIKSRIDNVRYMEKEEINYLNVLDEDIESKANTRVYQKWNIWSYENECRIAFPKGELENNVMKYEKTDLKGIIFGLKVNRDDVKSIHEIIEHNYLESVIFYKSVQGSYEITNEKIDDIDEYLETLEPTSGFASEFKC